MTSTRTASYEAIKPHLPRIKDRVLVTIQNFPRVSREEIAGYLGVRLSTVCVSVHGLLLEGRIKVVGATLNRDTNRMVEVLSV